MKKTFVYKVNITSASRFWDEPIDLADVFNDLTAVKIIGTICDEGRIDLIYTYEEEVDEEQ